MSSRGSAGGVERTANRGKVHVMTEGSILRQILLFALPMFVGNLNDHESIHQALADGTLDPRDLKRSIGRLCETVWQSNRYE